MSFVGRSQDFCCEMCGTSMKTALLPLTSGSVSSQADKEAKELARQISFKVKLLFKLLSLLYRIRKENTEGKTWKSQKHSSFQKTFINYYVEACLFQYSPKKKIRMDFLKFAA